MDKNVALHAALSAHFLSLLVKDKLPQALLLVGPRHANGLELVKQLLALFICQYEGDEKPCGHCRACHLCSQGMHPDITIIAPEAPSTVIKIEQVRHFQQSIYQTPQLAVRCYIVISAADKMNASAANALLKVLEEPPAHTMFILLAEQIASIPVTILSRCQKYTLAALGWNDLEQQTTTGYLNLGQHYTAESPRGQLMLQREAVISSLCDLIEAKTSVCTIAAKWSADPLEDVMWLLYLLTADVITCKLITSRAQGVDKHLLHFSEHLKVETLFVQLDKINAVIKKINHNIAMNQTLVLEAVLLGYLG